MAMNAKQRRHWQDGNECQTKKTLKQQNQQDGNECQTKKKALLNTTILVGQTKKQHNQQDGNECQTKKTRNTTKLVGWQ